MDCGDSDCWDIGCGGMDGGMPCWDMPGAGMPWGGIDCWGAGSWGVPYGPEAGPGYGDGALGAP
jgi:hypothetical protein